MSPEQRRGGGAQGPAVSSQVTLAQSADSAVWTLQAPVNDAVFTRVGTAHGSLTSVQNHRSGERVEQAAGVGPATSCSAARVCLFQPCFIQLAPPHSTLLLWLVTTRVSRTMCVFICSFDLSKYSVGSMYGETERFEKKI